VLANFCPSITDREQARKMERYRKGEDFLKAHDAISSLAYCSALSDTMHVCRSRNGDGTLLTSIWDTKDKSVSLYFYHSYDTAVRYSLAEALAKGDHVVDVPSLFPSNREFERLKSFKTPFNTPVLRVLLLVVAGLLSFFVFLLILAASKGKSTEISFKNGLLIAALNFSLVGYLFVLATNVYVYYFDAPYKHYGSGLISVSSYMPFLLLAAIAPVGLFTIKRFRSINTKGWIKATLVFNSLIYLILILSFAYWGLYWELKKKLRGIAYKSKHKVLAMQCFG
jgi:hypothetical protein